MAKAERLPSGSYRVKVYCRNENGKPKYESITAKTRKEAEYLAAMYSQTRCRSDRSQRTLGNEADEYVNSKRNVLSPSTLLGYETIRNYMKNIEGIKASDITQEIIQSEINRFAAAHSPKTCINYRAFLLAVLKACRPDLVLNIAVPSKKKKDIYVPDRNEVKEISKLVENTNVYIPFLLATQCGLRASEISGLEVKDVHKDHIKVTQARVDGDKGEALKSPKSFAGHRLIPISEKLYNILMANADGDRIYNKRSRTISNNWYKFRVKHKLNDSLNFHALRHFYASNCLLLQMPQKYIAELMGHGDTSMIEQVYQHTFPSVMSKYAENLRKSNDELL